MTQTAAAGSAATSGNSVKVRGLSRSFDGPNGAGRRVLDALDIDIAPGEFVALLGRSGSGKTTLLRALAGLDTVQHGRVDAPERRSVVFQEPRLLPWKKVWQNVTLGLHAADNGGSGGGGPKEVGLRGAAEAALAEVELTHRADAWPLTLSGGEAQRAGLARALVREPQLLLLDEPFAALDALTRLRMQALVAALVARHRPAVLLVTHDVDEALLLADRVLVLQDGRIRTELAVALDRPRDPGQDGFSDMRATLLRALGVDVSGPHRFAA